MKRLALSLHFMVVHLPCRPNTLTAYSSRPLQSHPSVLSACQLISQSVICLFVSLFFPSQTCDCGHVTDPKPDLKPLDIVVRDELQKG